MFCFDAADILAYHKEFRNALFVSGFTVGSFLFSMKTFIIKTMKDDIYDSEEYQKDIMERRKLGSKVGFYSPLKNFSKLLYFSIIFSFLSALSQISLGYIYDYKAVIFCLMLSVSSWILVGFAIYIVGVNWSKALDMSEKKALAKELEKKKVKTGNVSSVK